MIVDIQKARQRFGLRKQWRFTIRAGNNAKVSDADTYANPQNIVSVLRKFREEPVKVRIHYPHETVVIDL